MIPCTSHRAFNYGASFLFVSCNCEFVLGTSSYNRSIIYKECVFFSEGLMCVIFSQMDVTEPSAEIKTEKVPEIIEVKDEPQEKMTVDSKDENRDRKDREERRGEKRRRSPSPPRRRY
jgi:hypothetical protein